MDDSQRILQLEAQVKQLQAERDLAQKELAKLSLEAEKFSVAFELNPVAVSIVRLSDRKILDINKGFATLTGYSREEVVGKTSEQLNLWASNETRDSAYQALAQTGQIASQLHQFITKSGRQVAALVSAKIIQLDQAPHILFVAKDIQDLFAAQEELKLQQTRIRTLLDAPLALIMLLDENGLVLQANLSAARFFGHSLDEMLGHSLWDLMTPEQREVFGPRFATQMARGEMAAETDHLDGRWLHSIFYPARERAEGPKEAALVIRDITVAKMAELERAEQEQKYRALFEAMQDGFILFDVVYDDQGDAVDFSFVECNPALAQTNSLSEDFFAQGPLSQLQTSGDERWFRQLIEVARSGQPVQFEVENPQIELSLEVYAFVPQPGRLACLAHDVTQRKRNLKELAQAKATAESAVQAKSRFLATMSHEIRTPLNGVLGMTSLLEQSPLTDEQNEFVNIISQCGENLLGVINDILDFTKLESARVQFESMPLDLRQVIEETFSLCGTKAADKRLELLYHLHPQVPRRVLGDPVRIRQILLNLVGNGIKFSESGEVLVGVKVRPVQGPGLVLEFSVQDRGIGIATEQQENLFEAFNQVDSSTTRKYGGTGLGLAINKQLVELMGGEIWIESKPGAGSTFYFTIVVQEAPHQPERTPLPETLNEKQVYLLDDDPIHRSHLLNLLRQEGLEPEAIPLKGAIGRLKEFGPKALFIVNLPKSSTIDADLKAFCSHLSQTGRPLVKLGFLNHDHIEKSCPGGLLVNKPVRMDLLLQNLTRSIGLHKSHKLETTQRLDGELGVKYPLSLLVVEDNELNQALVLKLLDKMGFEADLAVDGLDGLKKIGQKSYDLILLDIQMPEMDGLEVTAELVQRQRRPWIVAMTANAMKGDKERYLQAGMDDYLSKPIDPYGLQDLLARYAKRLKSESGLP